MTGADSVGKMEQSGKYRFPKGLYADVRIEETYSIGLSVQDGDVIGDSAVTTVLAIVRVFDGEMWYVSTFSKLDDIQEEIDRLAEVATPNPAIEEQEVVKKFEVHRENILKFEGEKDVRGIPREQWWELLDGYIESCSAEEIPEISTWYGSVSGCYRKKGFWSSKGAEIVQDIQNCWLKMGYGITVGGVTVYGGKSYSKFTMDELRGREEEILAERKRYLDFAWNAVDLAPGEYTCVLAPFATAMFTHESFGHKSEADFMLHDKALQEEWVIGKKVGNEKVSICDSGDILGSGYVPYDDEGTKARETWLIREGVLTGRLHDAKSAVALGEELTGNSRADTALNVPIVRMTNTFMAAGNDDLEQMVREIKDGLYVYNVDYGTGQSIFTMKPLLCYRIREGKICEPVRVNVLTGSVFETLFEIDAVGNDFERFDTFSCGKSGQEIAVSAGGPSIRVRRLTVN